MNYYPQKSILVIFGGRCDTYDSNNATQCLNDIWILTLEKLLWTKWETKESPSPRYSHCSTVVNGSILIFGGLSDNNYCRARLLALDMDPIIHRFGYSIRNNMPRNTFVEDEKPQKVFPKLENDLKLYRKIELTTPSIQSNKRLRKDSYRKLDGISINKQNNFLVINQ